jgi:hypothetical protein
VERIRADTRSMGVDTHYTFPRTPPALLIDEVRLQALVAVALAVDIRGYTMRPRAHSYGFLTDRLSPQYLLIEIYSTVAPTETGTEVEQRQLKRARVSDAVRLSVYVEHVAVDGDVVRLTLPGVPLRRVSQLLRAQPDIGSRGAWGGAF